LTGEYIRLLFHYSRR